MHVIWRKLFLGLKIAYSNFTQNTCKTLAGYYLLNRYNIFKTFVLLIAPIKPAERIAPAAVEIKNGIIYA